MPAGYTIVGIGEAIFDIFPDGPRLGGAPLNVAVHSHQLGNTGIIVSRAGYDELGDQLIAEIRNRGMTLDHLQRDPDRPTGTVNVQTGRDGAKAFEIFRNVAWDNLQWDGDLDHLAAQCHAVCFGTLAQREAQTGNVIYRFVEAAHRAVRLLDANLRQDFYDRRTIVRSMELATAVKLTQKELQVVSELLDLPREEEMGAMQLIGRYSVQWVAVTHGSEGTVVYAADGRHAVEAVSASEVVNTVGAGDATCAALLHGMLRRWPWEKTLKLANTLAAYVVSQAGACPAVNDEIRKLAE